ncbi:3-hydroxyisobutyrate dehydrogenase [Roseovarius pacificus]|uniref:3-hydroxyisobutyrate dehydrogenase n=1 Tax=Roseovarius pacificus TaxID=337701 RepID=A0A1M7ADN0_9RHOB|nr:NAD(P)-dependent oxidoreductase [Roseovarius pacificus]GGO53588.1 2-hydroxy-3-oxopropionate reductase [Roseovarius pacificus]SHL40726.1 3-hydroxyisobutyrate dehydrogenase [Roseovarius pacificus]
MKDTDTIGFIGLGVMGGPMCRNIAVKHPGRVLCFDLSEDAVAALSDTKAERMDSVEALAKEADIICLSLPGGPQVQKVAGMIGPVAGAGKILVDLSTTTVSSARETADMLEPHGVDFIDAPVARTREAAQQGKLSIMVGGKPARYERVRPVLHYMASDVTHCGDVGAGQVLKLVNNMLVFANTVALAEMIVLGERAGVEADTLLDAVSKGSGDSFVLRNHGKKAMAPREFPEKSFPAEYVLKDISYVFDLADQTGTYIPAAEQARAYYQAAVEKGFGGKYFPSVIQLIDADEMERGT